MKLIKTLRWFGANDPISLEELSQTGATGIVTALHHIPNGEIWTEQEILKTKNRIEAHGMTWEVVESLPVHEDIKKGTSKRDELISNYKESIKNLGKCGINTICYNFMPVLDWARTTLEYRLPHGAEAMYFDKTLFAAFDIFILKRPNAEKDYKAEEVASAKAAYENLSEEDKDLLGYNIVVKTQSFIDGAVKEGERNYLKIFNDLIAEYDQIDKDQLRANFAWFLNEVIPTAEESGVRLAVHPDDPPFPLLGLPRIVSSADDFKWLAEACPSIYNGITFCTGSLGASKKNNLVEIFNRFGDRVHFLHLRMTKVLENGDFYETDHLDGQISEVMNAIIDEQIRRKNSGRQDYDIPMRPDHGHKILDDFKRNANPGYPLIGRMKGLSELAGLEQGVRFFKR